MRHYGRPFSVLTPEAVAGLVAEFNAAPFNISARARALGIKHQLLSYHLNGGKVGAALSGTTWRAALKQAYRALRADNTANAAHWLREAAARIEKTHTAPKPKPKTA
jgi:hypothetical protein